MKRPWHIFVLTLIIAALVFTYDTATQAKTKIRTSVAFNQLVYESPDPMTIKVTVAATEDIPDMRIALKIGKEDPYVFSRTIYIGNLKKDQKQTVVFEKNNALSFGLKAGRNPVLIDISSRLKTIAGFSTEVGLKESQHKHKLRMLLAVNIAHKIHLDLDKNVGDEVVQKELLPKIEQYYNLSKKNSSFLNFIFSPVLAETIDRIGAGYNLVKDGKQSFMPASSPSSIKARAVIEAYKKTNLLTTSYTSANPARLTKAGFDDQLSEGRKVLGKVFGDNMSVNLYFPTQRALLNKKDKQASAMQALAILTEAFNDKGETIVLVTDDMIRETNLSYFIEAAKKQKWLDLKSPFKLKIVNKPKTPHESNIAVFKKARDDYFLLQKALASQNQAFEQAKMAIFTAEDKYTNESEAKELALKAANLLSGELGKISLALTPLTLTGRNGKLPVKIVNNTGSKLKLNVSLQTDAFELKYANKSITAAPKENLVSIPAKVLKSGRHKVLVRLMAGNKVISAKYLTVSTNLPSTFWYYIGVFGIILLLIIIGAFYARERRSRISARS